MAQPRTIEEKYRKLTDIEHVLLRPGMYVGSTNSRQEDVFVVGEFGNFVRKNVVWNPAFLKIFDEIVSNSVDEHRRNPKLNEIRVESIPSKGLSRSGTMGGYPFGSTLSTMNGSRR